MLTIVADLFQEFTSANIRYCHWKSNIRLREALMGKADLDIWVHRADAWKAQEVLARLQFKQGVTMSHVTFPSMQHYYGLDEQTGIIAHVHLYFEIITGESLLKNYRLPVEDMLLENIHSFNGVQVPKKAAELVIFVLRMMLKQAVAVEYVLVAREYDEVIAELRWLLEEGDKTKQAALDLLKRYLPMVDQTLFQQCLEVLPCKRAVLKRYVLARRLRRSLSKYSRYPGLWAVILNNYRFLNMVWYKLVVRHKSQVLASGGIVIAFVGSEASGKSTLLSRSADWLGENFVVCTIHSGKPPPSWLTFFPALFLPLLRRLLPKQRLGTFEVNECETYDSDDKEEMHSLISLIRSVMVAYDQRKELLRAFRKASGEATIVLCDRYPSATRGGMDGPRVDPSWFSSRYSVKRKLAEYERLLYDGIPPPNLAILLRVPVEVAVRRNAARGKKDGEDEAYVRHRYKLMDKWSLPNTFVYRIDNNKPLEETLLEIKRTIWKIL